MHSERSQRCCAGRIRGGNRVSVPPKLAQNGRETAEISPSQNRRFEILAKFGLKIAKIAKSKSQREKTYRRQLFLKAVCWREGKRLGCRKSRPKILRISGVLVFGHTNFCAFRECLFFAIPNFAHLGSACFAGHQMSGLIVMIDDFTSSSACSVLFKIGQQCLSQAPGRTSTHLGAQFHRSPDLARLSKTPPASGM